MTPDKLFEDIEGFVSNSRLLLEAGAVMELAGLENRVLTLCQDVLALSDDQRIRYAGRLQKLFAQLEALGGELEARRDALGTEIRSLPQMKKASVAYKVVDASDRKGEGDE